MSDIKFVLKSFEERGEGEVVIQGGSVTHTDYASYYRVRSHNIIVLVKVYKDGSIKVLAEKSLDSGGFLSMPWKEFNERIEKY